jgi:hypothetical protein
MKAVRDANRKAMDCQEEAESYSKREANLKDVGTVA